MSRPDDEVTQVRHAAVLYHERHVQIETERRMQVRSAVQPSVFDYEALLDGQPFGFYTTYAEAAAALKRAIADEPEGFRQLGEARPD